VLTLLIIGILYLIRQKKICRDKYDKTDRTSVLFLITKLTVPT
jgi:hypothetical protein